MPFGLERQSQLWHLRGCIFFATLPPAPDGALSFFSLDSHLSFLWLIYKLAFHHLPSSFCCLLFSVTMNPRGRRHPPVHRKPVYASALAAVSFEPTKAAMFSDGSPWRASRTLLLHRGISRSLASQEDSFLMGIHPWGQLRALTFSRLPPAQVGVSTYSKINDLLGLDTRAWVPLPLPSSPRIVRLCSLPDSSSPFLLSKHNKFCFFGTKS